MPHLTKTRYDWQLNPSFTQSFTPGQFVRLNPSWPCYDLLKKEFGHMFPRYVESVDGDVVRIKTGKTSMSFAACVLDRFVA